MGILLYTFIAKHTPRIYPVTYNINPKMRTPKTLLNQRLRVKKMPHQIIIKLHITHIRHLLPVIRQQTSINHPNRPTTPRFRRLTLSDGPHGTPEAPRLPAIMETSISRLSNMSSRLPLGKVQYSS